jgi:hypothetical protein
MQQHSGDFPISRKQFISMNWRIRREKVAVLAQENADNELPIVSLQAERYQNWGAFTTRLLKRMFMYVALKKFEDVFRLSKNFHWLV